MSWTLRRFQIVTSGAIVAVWVACYTALFVTADTAPPLETFVRSLVLPPVLWVLTAQILLHHWWTATGSRLSTLDPPARLLATAVAALPEHQQEWGRAMTAELAGVQGRSARWRFALSTARATLWLRPAGGWPVLVLVSAAVVASAAVAGPAAGAAVPGLRVFAVFFTALLGALVVLAVARSRRPRRPIPAPAALVTVGVAASIAVTVMFLLREPAAAEFLPPGGAVYVAAVLAGCLWVAVAAPRWLGANRFAAHLGASAGVLFAAWFVLAARVDTLHLPVSLQILYTLVLLPTPLALLFLPPLLAGIVGRSFRAGLQAAVWTVITVMPLTYAVWLPEGLRRHAIDGALLDGDVAAVGVNLADARFGALGAVLLIGLPIGVLGAGLAGLINRLAAGARR